MFFLPVPIPVAGFGDGYGEEEALCVESEDGVESWLQTGVRRSEDWMMERVAVEESVIIWFRGAVIVCGW